MRGKAVNQAAWMVPRRVSLINSYRMREARRLVIDGTYPAQHLWGTWNLSGKWSTAVTNVCMNRIGEKYQWARGIVKHIERILGDPFQTIWAVVGSNRGSIIYAANPKTGTLIGALKRLRLTRVPYIVLVHSHPLSSWAAWCLRSADAVLVFSQQIKDKLIKDGYPASRVTVTQWGPDLDWQGYKQPSTSNTAHFVSAGKTNRDYSSLRSLASQGLLNGHILDGEKAIEYRDGASHAVVGRPSYPEVMTLMASADVVCIPLEDAGMLSGLTEVSDAIALGKPLVMSRNSWMPIDIEELGIGVWLTDRSPATLQSAIEQAALIPRSSVLAVAEWFNMRTFSSVLEDVLDDVWMRVHD
ncbi:glycosyltransferase involved in cell wall biosynthesis [Pseudarthrobacter oxydans]|uniref:Glycosyltransferase involved in cell wall biosynthesis n=1 Tax=Pseudarthrobacter oxydans TaxID=1671 RepID=A0AAW8N8R2_PSEOX|nr:glycosyltransferase [Pseudarthrobacter oxydans]MDR6790955.1 glycosyltransferase involved in cell wall biosynthesis [Pseudarthrobacter oxydans]MDR7162617.1 glycosyltransferase involved in cell wall biosynthesis [Pseudarthrobacter oxydans]